VFVPPPYPPLARAAKIEGLVTFNVTIDSDGNATNFVLENGHPMFRGVVEKAVSEWKFSKEAANQKIRASVEFALNCPAKQQ
jgi:protein TonB